MTPAAPQIVRSGETSLEGLVRDLLRPELAKWLDSNLPPLVERLVDTAEQARALVSATRYPPQGVRGIGPVTSSWIIEFCRTAGWPPASRSVPAWHLECPWQGRGQRAPVSAAARLGYWCARGRRLDGGQRLPVPIGVPTRTRACVPLPSGAGRVKYLDTLQADWW